MAGEDEDEFGRNYAEERAKDLLDRYRANGDKIIERNDIVTKTVATVGAGALSTFSIAKAVDVFPLPPESEAQLALVLMMLGLALMLIAGIFIVRRLSRGQSPLGLSADLDHLPSGELDAEEKKLARKFYDGTAGWNIPADWAEEHGDKKFTLADYLEQAAALDKAAGDSDSKAARIKRRKANVIFLEVQATIERARLNVFRRRSQRMVTSLAAPAVTFAIGVFMFAVYADKIDSLRTGQVAVAKGCAEARGLDDIVEGELPEICGEKPTPPEDNPSAAESRETAFSTLATALTECRAAARKSKEPTTGCDELSSAVAALTPRG